MGYKYDITEVIVKGSELIRKKGYHQVGINEVLEECNIPKGSFYNFFKSKEDFAHKILDQYGENNLKMIRTWLEDESLSPLNRLKSFYKMLIEANVADGLDAGCLVNNISIELGGIQPELTDTADRNFRRWIGVIAACVRKGQEAGEITGALPPEDIAEYLHAGMYGAFARMKATQGREYLDKWYRMTFDFISTPQGTGNQVPPKF